MRHIYRCTQRRLQITYLNLKPIASRRFYPHRDDDIHLLMTSMRHGSWVPVITATDNCGKCPSPTTPRNGRSTHTCTITLRSQHGETRISRHRHIIIILDHRSISENTRRQYWFYANLYIQPMAGILY